MRLPLLGQPYQGQSIIASAQRAINLYAESNAGNPTAPSPITHYPTPGYALFGAPLNPAASRCTYRTSLGTVYTVVGNSVYFVNLNGAFVFVGSIPDRQSQVIMADNGLAVVLVDGVEGWTIDINTNAFAQIVDPSFYGADFVAFLDTFFVFNRPDTNQFYISLSQVSFALLSGTAVGTGSITAPGAAYTNGTYNGVALTGGSGTGATADITVAGGVVTAVIIDSVGINYLVGDVLSTNAADIGGTGAGFTWTMSTFALAFDPLDIAAKSGNADPIVAILTVHKELWLIGELTTEVWIGTGAADFYFQLVQGAYIEHGCIAPYSAANQDIVTFFLMQDKQGKNMVVKGSGYEISDIGTPFLVSEFNGYDTTADAIGFCFQINDHAFYCLQFPQASKTWLYELKTGLWCEWLSSNENGIFSRHRSNCCCFAFGKVLIGDYQNGKIYNLDAELFTDDDNEVVRIRTFMHIIDNFDRIIYSSFDADVTVGTQDPDNPVEPEILLSWSDDRGVTFGFPLSQSLGLGGDYLTTVSWNRCGMARDRVFKLQWSEPIKMALNGGFIETKKART